ncbi:MerR family transcriptional regulator [Streptomyces qinzhouensis]|uniref:helix-turn-helix domain-containing protein n=1 Tax=Streptomyces qinzhouensis TaxID=2599401 RepID=UPI001C97D207|nr:MerR family transcriptional regulator [Streptomyces qinzhouensis]
MTRQGVSIGEAAALYGLAPSTVRWWERQGVLDPPARVGGKRLYDEAGLRRLGLAYLCCVVGRMPLDQAAVVTSGKAALSTWQRTIDEQTELLELRIGQLEAALEYLRHLRLCEDDDIVRDCPVLESELSAHTPRGRAPGADLITAARAARGGGAWWEGTAVRDESPAEHPPGDEKPGGEVPVCCPGCRGPVVPSPRGRPRTYCSAACRQRAYRTRRSNTSDPAPEGPDRS